MEKRLGIKDVLEIEINVLVLNFLLVMNIFLKMVSIWVRIGWFIYGYLVVDVNIYSSGGLGMEDIRGNVENIEVGGFLRRYLDVDVDEIIRELREKMVVDVKEVEMIGRDGYFEEWFVEVDGLVGYVMV